MAHTNTATERFDRAVIVIDGAHGASNGMQTHPLSAPRGSVTAATAIPLVPDLGAASTFLAALDPGADVFTFQTFPDGKARHGITATKEVSLIDAAPLLIAANRGGSGVFVTINAMNGGGERKRENFARVRAVWAELDDGLPDTPWPLEPSIIVESSRGKYHVYWLVSDHMDASTHLGVERRLCLDWKADANAVDLTRVLRVPGFWHQKKPPVFQVRLVSCDPTRRYRTDALCAAFPPLAPVDGRDAGPPARCGRVVADDDDYAAVKSALAFLADKTAADADPDGSYPLCVDDRRTWISFGMALKREFDDGGFDLWDDWSSHSAKYDASDMQQRWDGFPLDVGGRSRGVTVGSIFGLAKRHGWQRPAANPFAAVQGVAPDPEFTPSDGLTPREWAQKVSDWGRQENVAELMQRMGKVHAFIEDGQRYLHRQSDGSFVFLGERSMRALYAGIYPHGRGQFAFDAFVTWPGLTTYRGLGFYPGSAKNPPDVPRSTLNTWSGLAVEPAQGDWSLFAAHLRDVICGGNAEHETYLLDWLAHAVQRPQEKPGSAVVLQGAAKGTGKSTVSRLFASLFRPENVLSIAQGQRLTGNFNAHFEKAIFVANEEASWAGDKSANGVLKDLITAETMTYEAKGRDAYNGPNFSRFMYTSNEEHVVPAGTDERRYFVLTVKPRARYEKSYFDALNAQMRNGGLAAFLYDLMERQITSDFYKPPATAALIEQKLHGLTGLQNGWDEIARTGVIKSADGFHVRLADDAPTEVDAEALQGALRAHCNAFEARGLTRVAGKQAASLGLSNKQKRRGDDRVQVYLAPPLSELRGRITALLGLPPDHYSRDDAAVEVEEAPEQGF